ncbi:MAG: hypothetical protein PHT63_02340 [Bacteroidales bacterium]|nr:hypothetical protein [Bacteroidales bacterium]
MKRVLFTMLFTVLCILGFSQSYQKAAGLRAGSSLGLSYKQCLSPVKAVEGIADLDIIGRNFMKFKVSGYYLHHFDMDAEGLTLFAGPGASAGLYVSGEYKDKLILSLDLMGGIEYKFPNAPFILAFDWNPKLQMITDAGFKPASFGLTARYVF